MTEADIEDLARTGVPAATTGPDSARALGDAVGALARAGLLAPGEPAGTADSANGLRAQVVGRPWAAVRPILGSLGFAEAEAERDGSRTYAAYDPVADRWLRLRLEPVGAAGAGESDKDRGAGLVVAILGPDGAGKSTLTAAVAESFVLPVRQFYAGLYPAGRRRFRQPGLATIALLLRLWRLAIRATWHRRRGRLVLFDRYAYDARLPLPRSAGRRTRLRRAILARSLPTPDLVVVLDAPAEVLLARRDEHPIEVIEAQRRRYAELAGSVPDAVIVDASADADTVRRGVTALIWARFAARQARRDA